MRKELEQRAQQAILNSIIQNYKQQHTDWQKDPNIKKKLFDAVFYKPANAIIIATAIFSAGFIPLLLLPLLAVAAPLFLVLGGTIPLLLGLLMEATFLIQSLKDEKLHAKAVADMLQPNISFDLSMIKDKELEAKVDKALEYWSLIDDAVENTADGPLRDRMANTTREVTHWLQAVFNLAERVDKFRQNTVIARDLKAVPKAIAEDKKRLKEENSPEVKEQLAKTIADRERQLRTLENLEDNMEKASYQIDSTISSLGTIYSQLLLVGSKDESGSKIARLQGEISEQVHQLEDLTEAMDEVYVSSY